MDVSQQTVVVCIPATETVGPCPDGQAPTTVTAAIVGASDAQALQHLGAVDYAQATGFWGVAFAAIVGVWWVGKIVRTAVVLIK